MQRGGGLILGAALTALALATFVVGTARLVWTAARPGPGAKTRFVEATNGLIKSPFVAKILNPFDSSNSPTLLLADD